MTTSVEQALKQKSQRRLFWLCSVALVPLGFAYVLYYFIAGSQPWATSSEGLLLNPILSADDLGLKNTQGETLALADERLWWLMVVSESDCRSECENALHLLRGVQVLLNKDMSRVRRAWLRLGDAEDSVGAGDINEKYPQLRTFFAQSEALKPGVYIVDPLANIVFFYEYTEAGKPLLHDLKKLLKVSRIG